MTVEGTPPAMGNFSKITALCPCWAKYQAQASPAGPAPTIAVFPIASLGHAGRISFSDSEFAARTVDNFISRIRTAPS